MGGGIASKWIWILGGANKVIALKRTQLSNASATRRVKNVRSPWEDTQTPGGDEELHERSNERRGVESEPTGHLIDRLARAEACDGQRKG